MWLFMWLFAQFRPMLRRGVVRIRPLLFTAIEIAIGQAAGLESIRDPAEGGRVLGDLFSLTNPSGRASPESSTSEPAFARECDL